MTSLKALVNSILVFLMGYFVLTLVSDEFRQGNQYVYLGAVVGVLCALCLFFIADKKWGKKSGAKKREVQKFIVSWYSGRNLLYILLFSSVISFTAFVLGPNSVVLFLGFLGVLTCGIALRALVIVIYRRGLQE